MFVKKVSESTIVLTGGRITLNLVTEYSGLETGGWEVFHPFVFVFVPQFDVEVSSRQLPGLITGRRQHACGTYPGSEGQVEKVIHSSYLFEFNLFIFSLIPVS